MVVPFLDELLSNTRQTLLGRRGPHGHWEGELSSSALSTATAVMALQAVATAANLPPSFDRAELLELVARGRNWLLSAQNNDGGWGDTTLSHSNISTTALVWAALSNTGEYFGSAVQRCEAWITHTAGSLEPQRLAKVITARYGTDHTFSVPILTALALRGRLGDEPQAWDLVPALPFELAAFPHRWYARLKLPVVSYALPALIAIGQVRHFRRPAWNPVVRSVRNMTQQRTRRVLREIQPASGGFLEATPLTSFVVMSLVGAQGIQDDVVQRGAEFLKRSIRPDGSWPIDTNLSTWVTTLSVNALSTAGPLADSIPPAEQQPVLEWLLNQQLQTEHPYTHAAPGGWAWTDLTGGVPDADDTPGALLALWHLAGPIQVASAVKGVEWLLDLQNADGGLPTFCRGWGLLPFDRSSCDLTAHALRAWSVWFAVLPEQLQKRILRASRRALSFLAKQQRSDGSWAPLWFGNQHATIEENLTYGTSRVLLALSTISLPGIDGQMGCNLRAATNWFLSAQNSDGGWGSGSNTPSSIEETALTIEALCAAAQADLDRNTLVQERRAIAAGLTWLYEHTQAGREFPPSPIGFYFAKLWYFEQMYPVVYTMAAMGRVKLFSAQLGL